jgi:hypothetical protein
MSLSDPTVLTYATVAKSLNRTNQDNFGSTYYLEDGTKRFTLNVKNTIPAKGKSGESHLIRLDVEHYDANNLLLRVSSAWTVIRTDDGIQDATSSQDAALALAGFLTAANIAKLVSRQH